MEESMKEVKEIKSIFDLNKEELMKIFEQMSLSEIEDMINMLNEVKNND